MRQQYAFKVVFEGGRGRWRWRMKKANSKIVAASTEAYLERRKAIANFQDVTGIDVRVRRPKSGPFFFHVAHSERRSRT